MCGKDDREGDDRDRLLLLLLTVLQRDMMKREEVRERTVKWMKKLWGKQLGKQVLNTN